MAEFVAVCRSEEVVEGRGVSVEVDGLRVAVFNDGGEFRATLGRCPHADGALGLGWVEDGEVVCPLHHWRFKLASGRCSTVRGESVHRFDCEARGDEVWVAV